MAQQTAATKKAIDDAVEAQLKVYKTKVAEKVKNYLDSGDLCQDEASRIREDLDLEEYLPRRVSFMTRINGDLTLEWEGGPPVGSYDGYLGEALSDAFCDLLKEGQTVKVRVFTRGTYIEHTVKVTLKETEIDDYNLDDLN